MALRDSLNKLASYLNPDDYVDSDQLLEELEEEESRGGQTVVAERQVQEHRVPEPQVQDYQVPEQRTVAGETVRTDYQRQQTQPVRQQRDTIQPTDYEAFSRRPAAPTERPNVKIQSNQEGEKGLQPTITLRHPLNYDDAPGIADLFLAGESVLIDFQYMEETQARRCIDFFWGACRVKNGNLQRIGGSMFLLTPAEVSVNIDEIVDKNKRDQGTGYDYDMRTRQR